MYNIFDYKDNLHTMDHIPAVLKQGSQEGPKPDVSIVMPVYNHPYFFKIAIDTALAQDYNGVYDIVVLDNNMDNDLDNINEFEQYVIDKKDSRILYFKNKENIQGLNSYNRLPQIARADYFVFLHDDDELCPNCLSELMKAKEKYGVTNELILPAVIPIDKDSNRIGANKLNRMRDVWGRDYKMSLFDWFLTSYTNGGGVLHNRESFIKLGGYCKDNVPSADYAFYALYAKTYGSIYLNKPLFRYRWAENDSMIVYEQCTERDRQYRNDMKKYIPIPVILLNLYINAAYRARLATSDVRFKGKTHRPISLADRLIMKLFIVLKMVSHLV